MKVWTEALKEATLAAYKAANQGAVLGITSQISEGAGKLANKASGKVAKAIVETGVPVAGLLLTYSPIGQRIPEFVRSGIRTGCTFSLMGTSARQTRTFIRSVLGTSTDD